VLTVGLLSSVDLSSKRYIGKAYSRYSYLVDKMFLETLSIEEEIEMQKLEEQLDSAETQFYEPIKQLLVATLSELNRKKSSKGG
jgi:hypothetical protein